jgi:hypothetical protein
MPPHNNRTLLILSIFTLSFLGISILALAPLESPPPTLQPLFERVARLEQYTGIPPGNARIPAPARLRTRLARLEAQVGPVRGPVPHRGSLQRRATDSAQALQELQRAVARLSARVDALERADSKAHVARRDSGREVDRELSRVTQRLTDLERSLERLAGGR